MSLERALIDGREFGLTEAALSVTDTGVTRGDGVFETVGVWDGRTFRLADHLERLTRSARVIGLPKPDLALLEEEADQLLRDCDQDAALRFFVTGSGTRLVTLSEQPTRRPPDHLVSQLAPWIRPLGSYGPAGAKTMSYGPNMAATRAAERAGGVDALLVALEGYVLEGPTFCLLWTADGVLFTPEVELGIVDSISRRTLVELARAEGLVVREGRYTLRDLHAGQEVLACSSVRPVVGVRRIDDIPFAPHGEVTAVLAEAMQRRRRAS